jgi:hypothetical protein
MNKKKDQRKFDYFNFYMEEIKRRNRLINGERLLERINKDFS